MTVKMFFSGFLVEHNLHLRTANQAAKLFKNMFSDSKIVNKDNTCDHTKATHMLTRALSEQITSDLRRAVVDSLVWISRDERSDKDNKFLPVLHHVSASWLSFW